MLPLMNFVYNEENLIDKNFMEGDILGDQIVEERQETCSIVSKIVKIKIFRRIVKGASLQEGEIVGYDCGSSSSSCESRCHYRLLIDDY